MSYYTEQWRINHFFTPSSALTVEGCRFKGYTYKNNVFVDCGECNYKLNFLYAMNTNKDVTTFELMYRMTRNDQYGGGWVPVPEEVLEGLFKQNDGTWNFCAMYSSNEDWAKNTIIEVVDGHFLFKYRTRWLRNKIASISVDSMHYSVPGRMVYETDSNLGVALAFYPKMKYTMDDTSNILTALSKIKNVEWALSDADCQTSRKRRLMDRLKKTHDDLSEYERKYQEILDKAADAMNLMSSKYGIEVSI